MKVHELIEELSQYGADTEVKIIVGANEIEFECDCCGTTTTHGDYASKCDIGDVVMGNTSGEVHLVCEMEP